MPERYQLECIGEDVDMVVEDNGYVIFEGWDEEAEAAWLAIGGEPSPCWIIARAIEKGKLDEELLKQAQTANTQLVEALIAAGADIDAKDAEGNEPLHWAGVCGHIDTAILLLENGANVNAKANENWTPLHWAAWVGYDNICAMLLDNGADINARDDNGWTPLHKVAAHGSTNITDFLLKNGADQTIADNYGWTPIQSAIGNGHKAIPTLLTSWAKKPKLA